MHSGVPTTSVTPPGVTGKDVGVADGRWTMDDGRWTMDDGRWTMDDGRWTMDDNDDANKRSLLLRLFSEAHYSPPQGLLPMPVHASFLLSSLLRIFHGCEKVQALCDEQKPVCFATWVFESKRVGGVVDAHMISGPISSILFSRSVPLIGHAYHFDRVDGLTPTRPRCRRSWDTSFDQFLDEHFAHEGAPVATISTRDRHGAKECHRSVEAGEFHRSYGLDVDIVIVELRTPSSSASSSAATTSTRSLAQLDGLSPEMKAALSQFILEVVKGDAARTK